MCLFPYYQILFWTASTAPSTLGVNFHHYHEMGLCPVGRQAKLPFNFLPSS